MAKRKRRHPQSSPETALRTSGLTKSYGDLVALSPLDLSVTEGQLVAVVGHNGSGKSTLLQLTAGLLDATDGTVEVHGHPAGSDRARAAVSYLGDSPVLYDDLSVWEHLEYLSRLHGVTDWEPTGRELLERFDLTDRADDLPVRFSRGLRQKTALVVGLVRRARLLLIDEPFVGLDTRGKTELVAIIAEQHRAGATIVVATHDLELLGDVDRCLVLHNGTVAHDGPSVGLVRTGLIG